MSSSDSKEKPSVEKLPALEVTVTNQPVEENRESEDERYGETDEIEESFFEETD